MILDYPFQPGRNNEVIELNVELRIMRRYHKIAQMEYDMFIDLEQDTIMRHPYSYIYDFKSPTNFKNFEHQIGLLKTKISDKRHAENLLYLALTIIKTDKVLILSHYSRYPELLNHVKLFKQIWHYSDKNTLASLELTFIDKDHTTRPKEIARGGVAKALLMSMVRPYFDYLVSDHLDTISFVLKREVTKDNFTYGDLIEIEELLNTISDQDPERAFDYHLMTSMLKYIRENRVVPAKTDESKDYPNAQEARLLYIIRLLATGSPVLSNRPKKSKTVFVGTKISNYNTTITADVIATFKHYQVFQKPKNKFSRTDYHINDFFKLYVK